MKITNVSIRKSDREDSRMKAIASVLLDDEFAVHDIRIIEGTKGLFIAMPSRKTATGGYRDIAHPINPEVRAMFEEAILEAYKNAPESSEEDIIIASIEKGHKDIKEGKYYTTEEIIEYFNNLATSC